MMYRTYITTGICPKLMRKIDSADRRALHSEQNTINILPRLFLFRQPRIFHSLNIFFPLSYSGAILYKKRSRREIHAEAPLGNTAQRPPIGLAPHLLALFPSFCTAHLRYYLCAVLPLISCNPCIDIGSVQNGISHFCILFLSGN